MVHHLFVPLPLTMFYYFRNLLYFVGILLAKETDKTAIENLKIESQENCFPLNELQSRVVSRDLCTKNAELQFLINKSLPSYFINEIGYQLFDVSFTLPYREFKDLNRFFCIMAWIACEESDQIVQPCRSLCKSAEKSYRFQIFY